MNVSKQYSTSAVSGAKSERVRGLFIDGKEQPAGKRERFSVVSPGTGDVIAHTVDADESDVDAAVASARRAFESAPWRKMSERSRAKLVYNLGDALEKHLDELYELETLHNLNRVAPLTTKLFARNQQVSGHAATLLSF
jgi:acyl-CoA reductase-like NAD-dependent aldehyde dehydrogenase